MPYSPAVLTSLLLFCIGSFASATTFTSFRGLGQLPQGLHSVATGVSPDGSHIVGYSFVGGFLYHDGQMKGLGFLSPPDSETRAFAVSGDGSRVVGVSESVSGDESFIVDSGTIMPLATIATNIDLINGLPLAISPDGNSIVGRFEVDGVSKAYSIKGNVFHLLADMHPELANSQASDVSDDGNTIVGHMEGPDGLEAFVLQDGNFMELGDLPGGQFRSVATGVSADGSIVVGQSWSGSGFQAFVYENGEMREFGGVSASDVSGDGSMIIGITRSINGLEAAYWDENQVARTIREGLLESGFDVVADGWLLSDARAVSADGSTIVGVGEHNDVTEAWVATIAVPEPNAICVLLFGTMLLLQAKYRHRS
ncbi:MAG: hypothetical protein AAF497_17305 [Planctomycetota bacterium]